MSRFSQAFRPRVMLMMVALLLVLAGCQAPADVNPSQPNVDVTDDPPAPTAQPAPATPQPTSTPIPVVVAEPTATKTPVVPLNPTSTEVATTSAEPTAPAELQIAPIAGALAPDFDLPGIDGSEVALSDLQGKVVLVNFWTTW